MTKGIVVLQWICLFLFAASLVVFFSRPVLFLLAGLGSGGTLLPPHYGYNILLYISISAKIVLLFAIIIFNSYQTKAPFGEFLLTIIIGVSLVSGVALLICCIISASTCNDASIPNNLCNSYLWCCYFAHTACGGTPNYCSTLPALTNPRVGPLLANDMFIEFFVWIGVFLGFDLLHYFVQHQIIADRRKTSGLGKLDTPTKPISELLRISSMIVDHIAPYRDKLTESWKKRI